MLFLEQDQRKNKNNQICTTCKVYTASEDEWGKKTRRQENFSSSNIIPQRSLSSVEQEECKKTKKKNKFRM